VRSVIVVTKERFCDNGGYINKRFAHIINHNNLTLSS